MNSTETKERDLVERVEVMVYTNTETGEIYETESEARNARTQKAIEIMKNKNPPFVQLAKEISPPTIGRLSRRSALAVEVLMYFFDNMSKTNVIMISQQSIGDKLGVSRQSISKAINVLKDEDIIGIAKISNANVYIINPAMVWGDTNQKRGLVTLNGNILLGEDENEALFKRFRNIEKNRGIYTEDSKAVNTKFIK